MPRNFTNLYLEDFSAHTIRGFLRSGLPFIIEVRGAESEEVLPFVENCGETLIASPSAAPWAFNSLSITAETRFNNAEIAIAIAYEKGGSLYWRGVATENFRIITEEISLDQSKGKKIDTTPARKNQALVSYIEQPIQRASAIKILHDKEKTLTATTIPYEVDQRKYAILAEQNFIRVSNKHDGSILQEALKQFKNQFKNPDRSLFQPIIQNILTTLGTVVEKLGKSSPDYQAECIKVLYTTMNYMENPARYKTDLLLLAQRTQGHPSCSMKTIGVLLIILGVAVFAGGMVYGGMGGVPGWVLMAEGAGLFLTGAATTGYGTRHGVSKRIHQLVVANENTEALSF